MRVDGIVDERLDPYSATEAAANLMLYNYHCSAPGRWRSRRTTTDRAACGPRRMSSAPSDIAVIVKRYQGATFGFASRNFYVAFLAALEVDRNAEKYFGPITRLPDTENTPVRLSRLHRGERAGEGFQGRHGRAQSPEPRAAPADLERLALRAARLCAAPAGRAVRSGDRRGLGRLPPSQRYLAQRNDGATTFAVARRWPGIAAASGVSLSHRLVAANGWNTGHTIARGDVVRIPLPRHARGSCRRPRPPRRWRRTGRPRRAAPTPAATEPAPAAAAAAPAAAAAARTGLCSGRRRARRCCRRLRRRASSDTHGLRRGRRRYGDRAGRRDLGPFRGLEPRGSQELRTLNKLHKNADGARRPQDQARFVAGSAPPISWPRAASITIICRRSSSPPPHRRHRDLRGEARRIALDHRAATRRYAGLAGGPVQPRRELQRRAPGHAPSRCRGSRRSIVSEARGAIHASPRRTVRDSRCCEKAVSGGARSAWRHGEASSCLRLETSSNCGSSHALEGSRSSSK